VGLDDDTEYIDRWVGCLLAPFLAAPPPPAVARIQNPKSFKLALATLHVAESSAFEKKSLNGLINPPDQS